MNALPYLYTWIRHGNWRSFFKGAALFTAAAAAHHATLLFGSFFFAVPVLVLAFLDRNEGERASTLCITRSRTVGIVLVVGAAIADCSSSLLDRAYSLSSHADSDSASQPGELHFELRSGD